jgi:excinuclease ABC subunit A
MESLNNSFIVFILMVIEDCPINYFFIYNVLNTIYYLCEQDPARAQEAIEFFSAHQQKTIVSRLKPLESVGLGYIKLGQSSSTLSGGENQRVKLAYFIGQERQDPTLFIFDEPTTGLHFHDIRRLLSSFNALIERGHTILIIEHNLDVIKQADWCIDLGPDGGDRGGNLIVAGTPEQVANCKESITGKYLKELLKL